MSVLEIRPERYDGDTAQRLVAAMTTELRGRYEGRDGYGGEPAAADFEPPRGAFLVAYEGGRPVACAGVTPYEAGIAELRRLYVAPGARRRGISRRLLGKLEEKARSLGYRVIRLETGNRQAEAVALYESMGYVRIPRYGPYVDDERSACFEKPLSRVSRRP